MRHPLITPLASRDGSTDKDEKLVNAYGEVDRETKETSVFKRPGIDQGDAVITGPDTPGQGLFNYGGYLFAIIDDILCYWVYVGGQQGGGTYIGFGGAVGEWEDSETYDIGDQVVYDGTIYFNYIPGSGVAPGSDAYTWQQTQPGVHTYSCNYNSYAGPVCADKLSAAFAAYNLDPAHSCATKREIIPPNYGTWSTDWYVIGNAVYATQWATFDNCSTIQNGGIVQYGTITQVS